jgi:hypothetical protein
MAALDLVGNSSTPDAQSNFCIAAAIVTFTSSTA